MKNKERKILMKLSSAEGAKLLKKLKSEYDALKSKESISSTFLASVGENPESVRPKYDYKDAKAELDSLALKIRKLKHAFLRSAFNFVISSPCKSEVTYIIYASLIECRITKFFRLRLPLNLCNYSETV